MTKMKIFAGTASKELGEKVAQCFGKPLSIINFKRFADGEFRVDFDENIRGCDVFLIQSCYAPSDNYFELFQMIDAAKKASARKIIAVIPYFGYARQDRKDRPRVGITSQLVATFLEAAGATRVVAFDLHADQIQGFFRIPMDQLFTSYVYVPYLRQLGLKNLLMASPDVGAAKKAAHLAGILKTEMVICHKHRNADGVIDKMILIGDVEGKDVVIIDDIVDSGGTLIECANLIMKNGANSVRAGIIHPVLSGKAKQKIQDSVISELIVTDTIPLRLKDGEVYDKIKVLSVSELLSDAIIRINNDESVSELFKY